MTPTFFTFASSKFFAGAMALFRAVQFAFPTAPFILLPGDVGNAACRHAARCGVRVHPVENVKIWPDGDPRNVGASRYSVEQIPGEYLVYVDADAFMTAHIALLLEVPSGKIGVVSERYLTRYGREYTVGDQFDPGADLDRCDQYGTSARQPSFNCGVLAGERQAWLDLTQAIREVAAAEPELTNHARSDQGLFALAACSRQLVHELPENCNLYDEYWDGASAAILHFEGYDRPWVYGPPRKDNSYPAFKAWRHFSRMSDFAFSGDWYKELIWRPLDDLRPLKRRLAGMLHS